MSRLSKATKRRRVIEEMEYILNNDDDEQPNIDQTTDDLLIYSESVLNIESETINNGKYLI